MEKDSTVWINNSWGGHTKIVKTPKGKQYPKWLKITLASIIIIGAILMISLLIYLSQNLGN
tara:strand:- start:98 stop:280 length:183 start_codon:yes stop_codon:yes gene_type:complete